MGEGNKKIHISRGEGWGEGPNRGWELKNTLVMMCSSSCSLRTEEEEEEERHKKPVGYKQVFSS